jgi:hypothetical protein
MHVFRFRVPWTPFMRARHAVAGPSEGANLGLGRGPLKRPNRPWSAIRSKAKGKAGTVFVKRKKKFGALSSFFKDALL